MYLPDLSPVVSHTAFRSNLQRRGEGKCDKNLHLRLKSDADAALLLLDEKPRVRR